MTITDAAIRSAIQKAKKAKDEGAKPIVLKDTAPRGLELRVQPSTGTASWGMRVLVKGGPRVRVDLGSYPAMGLADARVAAGAIKAKARQGEDPRPKAERPPLTVAQALDRWLDDHKIRSADQTRRRFELHVLDFEDLGKREVATIEKRDIARLLSHLKNRKGLTAEVNRVRASLSALFGWLVQQGEVHDNPVRDTAKVEEPSHRRQKEGTARTLSIEELAIIWRSAEADTSAIASALVRLLILVPLRREEWTQARWDELQEADGGRTIFRLPPDRMKGKRAHAVPLPANAVAILKTLPRLGAFVFTADGEKPYHGWRRTAARLRDAAQLSDDWTIHDIRRGVATAMGEASIGESTIARILAHSPRSLMGVTAVYDRSERLDEMATALDRWQAVLARAVAGDEGAKVVAFPGRS